MPDILTESQDLREMIMDGLVNAIPGIEDRILLKMFQLIENYDQKNGKFEFSKMNMRNVASIQSHVEAILKESGYFKTANIYLNNLSKITDNTIALQKGFNKLDLQKKSLTEIEKVYRDNVVQKLSEAGLNYNFINPVTTIVNEAISFGYSIDATRKTLADFVTGGTDKNGVGKLKSYLTTTARDTITQMQGAQHQAVKNELAMAWVRYVGGIIKDSRGQCVRWSGMEYIAFEQLAAEIKLAFRNQESGTGKGTPHRWSGMIPNTTVDNFLIYRGGWGCLQQAIPVRKNPKIKTQ